MGTRLRRLLRIHAGEESSVGRMLVLMFSVWMAATIGASGIESLLFSRYGPHALPYLFIVIGLVTLPAMARLGALLERPHRRRILSLLFLALGIVLLAGRAMMLTGARWVYPILWLLMMVVWIMEATGAWAVASLVNNTRQAKRLFPLYGAGQIVGGAIGGLLTVPLARGLHAENLVFIWAGALVTASFLVSNLLSRGVDEPPRTGRVVGRPSTNVIRSIANGLRMIRSSPLLSWLAIAMILFSLLYNSLSFTFAEAVTSRFASTDSLAAFIGFFNALINAGGLVISLVVANRLFARFGVPMMVLTLALIYLLGFSGLTLTNSFGLLVAFRLVQMVWVNGVWITGWQALFTIVPPERRGQVTSFMDGAAWEAGMMLGGGAILLAEAFRGEETIPVLGVVAAGLLVLSMWRARRAYGPEVAEAVRAGRPDVFGSDEEPFGGFIKDASAVATLLESSRDPDPETRRLAIAIAVELRTHEVLPAIVHGLSDDDADVRATALRSLAAEPRDIPIHLLVDALSDTNAIVRSNAIDALVASSPETEVVRDRVLHMVSDPDPVVRTRAMLARASWGSEWNGLDELFAKLESSDSRERAAAVSALGDVGALEGAPIGLLNDPDPEVRRSALLALAPGVESAPLVIAALGDSDASVRDAALDAIAELGELAVEMLEDALTDPVLEPQALRALTRIGGARSPRLRSYALDQVHSATRYGRLSLQLGENEDERVQLLAHSLRSRMFLHAMNALWANAAWSGSHRLAPAIESLTSNHAGQRATALEAIESLGEHEIARPLLSIWEKEPDNSGRVAAVLRELFEDEDSWLRACAALASESVTDGVLISQLEGLSTSDPDPDVRTTARLALKGGEHVETLNTLPLMRRVLFLRKVELFSELAPTDLKSVAEAAGENLFTDGEVIAQQGEPGGELHVVVKGEIEVDMGAPERRVELARRGLGEVVGEMSLITGNPRMASLVAVGEVRTLSIDQIRFERIISDRPQVSLAVMRQLCTRLTQSMESLASK